MSEAIYCKRLAEKRFQKKKPRCPQDTESGINQSSITYGPLVFTVYSGTTFENCIYCPP